MNPIRHYSRIYYVYGRYHPRDAYGDEWFWHSSGLAEYDTYEEAKVASDNFSEEMGMTFDVYKIEIIETVTKEE